MPARRLAFPFLFAFAAGLIPSLGAAVPIPPPNFAVDDAVPGAGFVTPTGIAFLPDGRFFVAEKRGRVFEVRNGVKRATAIWTGDAEVNNDGDRGLLDVAVDPKYFTNHYIYLLYTVDPDTNGTDGGFGFGRITRYQVNFTDSATVIPSSRTILMGTNWPNGPLSASTSHTIGSLRWGRDGSLLASMGDGGHFEYPDDGGHDAAAFGAGRTSTYEDIGAFRSQDITVLPGKILRINPADGHGYASNPFANGNLASVQSRVWCYGLRNPFRFNVRPGTGSADTSAANPGVLYIGDVGLGTWEETNVSRTGRSNFGWPCYEGMGLTVGYQNQSPAHNGCNSFGTATNPIAAQGPISMWQHGSTSGSIPPGLSGNCSVGGVFYTGTSYPAPYRNQYIFADYGENWIKLMTVDANDNLVSVSNFISAADAPVGFATNPTNGDVYYVAITANQVRRIRYTGSGGGNGSPTAQIAASPSTGVAPLSVAFSSAGSSDPDSDPLTFAWVFTDGSSSTAANPTHVFANPGTYDVQLTVSDNRGGSDVEYITISVTSAPTAFPSTGILDRFNRANGPPGAPWVDNTSQFTIVSNTLAPQVTGDWFIEWNSGSFGPNQEVFVTLSAIDAAAPEHNLMLKTQGTTWASGHIEVCYNRAASTITVYTFMNPVWQSYGVLSSVTFAAGDRFGARALSNGRVQVFRNATLIGTVSTAGSPFSALGGLIGLSCSRATAARFDDFGGGNVVSSSNSAPVATIVGPADNSFYYTGQTVNLIGSATDAQSPPDSLTFGWIVDLIHNNHVHPATYTRTGSTASFVGENHDDGTGVHLLIKLNVSDPQGMISDTAKVSIWPEIDLRSSAVTVTPDPPTVGQSAHFVFSLTNAGRMPGPISHWVLRAGNTLVAEGDAIVPALGTTNLSADAALPTSGNVTLRLVADSLAAVFETSETNNASVRVLTVSPAAGNTPPVAAAAGVPTSGTAPLLVNFSGATSTDANGDSLTFAWVFGDGGTATGRLTSHSYAAAGNYAAILTVNDGRGGTDTASVAISVSPPATGFPQTAVLDNFNRANGAIGANWIDQPTRFSIASNTLAPGTGEAYSEWNGASFGPSQEVFVTLSTVNAASQEHNLMLKTQGTTWAGGHIEVCYLGTASRVIVYTFAPPTTWATWGTFNGVTYAAGDQFGARALSDGTVQVYKNAALIGTVSVAGWPFVAQGGRIGLSVWNASASRFDNFGGGTVAGTLVQANPQMPLAGRIGPQEALSLSAAYPNPTTGGVTMSLSLPRDEDVSLSVVDIQGREVWRAPARAYTAGRWSLSWDGRSSRGLVNTGVYLAQIHVGEKVFLRRVAVVR